MGGAAISPRDRCASRTILPAKMGRYEDPIARNSSRLAIIDTGGQPRIIGPAIAADRERMTAALVGAARDQPRISASAAGALVCRHRRAEELMFLRRVF
jgi:hypothetical protein